MTLFGRYVLKNRNNKILYYLRGALRELHPIEGSLNTFQRELGKRASRDLSHVQLRVDYYNKLTTLQPLSDKAMPLSALKWPRRERTYYIDTVEHTQYFPGDLKAEFLFGDITHVPEKPTIVKSRPIANDNTNSILLKLNKVRHFMFVEDFISFQKKKDKLVWRGVAAVAHRIEFMEKYFGHPLCNLGKINRGGSNDKWLQPRMSINQQLQYKFILSIEGNDVASNLKWIMSSNSIAVMPKPKYETWFMEDTLIPDHHYICIKDDYSDLEERLDYYTRHVDEALQIVENANMYVNQFKDHKRENLISLLVLEKYFLKTGQIEQSSFDH